MATELLCLHQLLPVALHIHLFDLFWINLIIFAKLMWCNILHNNICTTIKHLIPTIKLAKCSGNNMYNAKSSVAEEFISHQEILSSLQYAKQNANNKKLLQKIVSKAACFEGLSHREAITLLECEDKEILSEIYKLAKEIKQKFYGNRIVMFAPLYLSNYCVNSCLYCPYHAKNKNIPRKKLQGESLHFLDHVDAIFDNSLYDKFPETKCMFQSLHLSICQQLFILSLSRKKQKYSTQEIARRKLGE